MNRRRIFFFSSLIVTLSTFIILVTGSSILTIALDDANTVPLGTFITGAGLISLPLTIYWGIGEFRNPKGTLNTALVSMLKIILLLAVLWVPISYLLSGNLSFSFTEKESFQGGQIAMRWFWRLSYGISAGAVFTLFVYWVSLLFRKKQGKEK